jgi:hypothetical protein
MHSGPMGQILQQDGVFGSRLLSRMKQRCRVGQFHDPFSLSIG